MMNPKTLIVSTLAAMAVLLWTLAAFPSTVAEASRHSLGPEASPSPTPSPEDLVRITVSKPLLADPSTAPTSSEPPPEPGPAAIPALQGIIGADDRQRISPTTNAPWRSIVSLDVQFGSGKASCTGFFIGPRIVATAGHCVYNGGWATSIRVIPGRDSAEEPFGAQYAITAFTNSEWVDNGDPELDFGAVELPDDSLSTAVGWFPYGAFGDEDHPGLHQTANLAGYPGEEPVPFDCPQEGLGFSGCQLWFHSSDIRATSWQEFVECPGYPDPCSVIQKGLVNYTMDTSPGQSGAPVWLFNGSQRVAVAIHTYGYGADSPCETEGGPFNCGTLLTPMAAALFEFWGAAPHLNPILGLPPIPGPFIPETPPPPTPATLEVEACIPGRYFLQGIHVQNRYDASVDWKNQGLTPGYVDFSLNGNSTHKDASDNPVSMFYDMGSDLSYDLFGGFNKLSVKAVAQGGTELGPEELALVGVASPVWLPSPTPKQSGNCQAGKSQLTYVWETSFPDPSLEGQVTPPDWVPFIGGSPAGLKETQATVKLEAAPTGSGTAEVSGQTGFEVGGQDISGNASGMGQLSIREGVGVQLDAATLELDLRGEFVAERPVVDIICKTATGGLCPLREAEKNPVIGKPIRWFNERAVAAAEVAPTLEATTHFKSDQSKLQWESSTFGAEVRTTLSFILTFVEDITASIFGGGAPRAIFQVPPDPSYLKEMAIELFAGVKFALLFFECQYGTAHEWSHPSGASRSLPSPDNGCQAMSLDDLADPATYAVFRGNDPPQLALTSNPAALSTVERTIASNVFSESRPALASADSTLLLWVHADITKPALQSGEIYYSAYDGAAWSTPAGITNDNLLDSAPQVAFDLNGKGVAVWMRNKNVQSAATELNAAYTTAFELAYAVWEGSGWSAPAFLTTNNAFDHSPTLMRGNDGVLLLVWRQNAAGELLGDTTNPDVFLYSLWNGAAWSAPRTLLPDASGVLDLAAARHNAGMMAVVYSQDTDGDVGTAGDQELYQLTWNGTTWSSPLPLTNDSQPDNRPSLFYDSASKPRLLWLKGNTLYALINDLAGPPQAVTAESSAAMLDYVASQDNAGNLALLWQGYSAEGVDVFYAAYDEAHNVFSQVRQLTHDEPLEKFMAPTFAPAGEMLMGYNKTALVTETIAVSPTLAISNVTTFDRTDLFFLSHTFGPDLALETTDLAVDPPSPAFGSTAEISAMLHNIGDRAVANPAVNFYLGDPLDGGILIESATVSLTVAGGMTTTLSIDWTVPEGGGPFTVYAVSDPDDVVVELDETNNAASVTVDAGSVYLPLIVR